MTLQQFFRVLRARWLLMLVTFGTTVGAVVGVSLLMAPKYTATAAVVVDFKGIDPISGGLLPLLPLSGYMATQVDIITSHGVARKAVDLLKLADTPSAKELYERETQGRGAIRDFLAGLLLKDVKVDPSRESSLIQVSYRATDPRFAAAVANAFVQGYISTHLELKVEPARQNTAFFNEQVRLLKEGLEKAQSALSLYQREKGIVASDERLDVESARLNELSTQLVAAQAQTFDSVSRHRQLGDTTAKGGSAEAMAEVLNNPVIAQLRAQVAQHEGKLMELSGKLGRNHPQYQAAESELATLRQQLTEEVKTVARTVGTNSTLAQRREEQLRASLAAQRSKVLSLKQQRDEAAVLQRELENAQRAYDAVMSRVTQTRLESQTTQTNVMVVNEAVEPIEPSSPRILLNTILSIVVGTFLAVGLALLRELLDRVVRSEEDLEDALGLPVLGTLAPASRKSITALRGAAVPGASGAAGHQR